MKANMISVRDTLTILYSLFTREAYLYLLFEQQELIHGLLIKNGTDIVKHKSTGMLYLTLESGCVP